MFEVPAKDQTMISMLFPELQRLPTSEARRRAFAVAKREVGTRWGYWAAIAGIMAGSVCLQFSLPRLSIPGAWEGTMRWLVAVVTVMACGGLFLSFRKTIRHSLWRALADQGVPCCTSCGYDLTVNESGRCPECGEVISHAR